LDRRTPSGYFGPGYWQTLSRLAEERYTSRLESIFQGGPPVIFSVQLHRYIIPILTNQGSYRLQHTTVTPIPSVDGQAFTPCLPWKTTPI
jgi:hypothetical protein